jgi:hypothetical protein
MVATFRNGLLLILFQTKVPAPGIHALLYVVGMSRSFRQRFMLVFGIRFMNELVRGSYNASFSGFQIAFTSFMIEA